jgi:uncharacterized protein (DUF1684 family)
MKKLILIVCSVVAYHASAQDYVAEINAFRRQYLSEFLTEERSPIKDSADLKYIQFFAPDSDYRVEAEVTITKNLKPFDLPTMNGMSKKYKEYGMLSFTMLGQEFSIKLLKRVLRPDAPQDDHLFLPFLDETNGEETYGGGRYLDFEEDEIFDGILIVDFNKAYNPWCAFSGGYSCPKPPEENFLKIKVQAGEKNYLKHH